MPPVTRQSTIDFRKKKFLTDTLKKISNSSKESSSTSVSIARKALHDSNVIVGREKELLEITIFLKSHINSNTSGSLYISGLPGTGKTASVNYVIEQNNLEKYYHIVKINCTACNSSKTVFKKICEGLKLQLTGKTEKEVIQVLEKYLLSRHKTVLLILDEIDQLESKSQSVLYKIFEWPSLKKSKIVLIGIANAMDLTDRILPRLSVKVELKPILLHFVPYTKEEISKILKTRLTQIGADNMFASGSIELISAKVAGTSGDVRRALNLGIRAIEMAEQKNLNEIQNLINLNLTGEIKKDRLNKFNKIDAVKSPCKSSKEELNLNDFETNKSPMKRKLKCSDMNPNNNDLDTGGTLPKKLSKSSQKEKIFLKEMDFQKLSAAENSLKKIDSVQVLGKLHKNNEENVCSTKNLDSKFTPIKSPVKCLIKGENLRRSPRKLQFNIESHDVLKVVKTVFGTPINLKQDEESSFPLHQKLLICTVLLVIKKGNKKDLSIGKLHQIYSKVCSKRGITAVDKSGFLFLCRQVEVAGILQMGKGSGMQIKVSLQWDEYEIANSLKDLHLLSSVLNDTTCLCNSDT